MVRALAPGVTPGSPAGPLGGCEMRAALEVGDGSVTPQPLWPQLSHLHNTNTGQPGEP